MPAATSILAGAAVVSAGAGLWASTKSAPDPGPAPTNANYYEYDKDGNLTREQVWDASKNGYVAKTYQTDAEKADDLAKKDLRDQFLSNLSKTPEDRVKAYDEYATTFSKQMHKDVDEQYAKTTSAMEENLTGRGMLGSKAYADTMSELNKQKGEVDTDIAEKSALAKETLASNDRNFWLQGMTSLDSGMRADQAQGIMAANSAANIANQGTAGSIGSYAAQNNANYAKWQQQQYNAQNLTNTATGLAFLYGYTRNDPKPEKQPEPRRTGNFDFGFG